MSPLLDNQLALVLHGSLARYGLNPRDWDVDFSHLKTLRRNRKEFQFQNIIVRKKKDGDISLHGSARATLDGSIIKATWLAMSLDT